MSTTNKHAYLIIAHQNSYVLEKLIRLIDDERNDIFIHIDKKATDFDFAYYQALPKKSNLIYTERIKVYWGHVSQIHSELVLFRTAFSHNTYSRYHLLSGSDLPLKSQDEIHDFFDKYRDNEFIGVSHFPYERNKIHKIHLNRKYLNKSNNYSLSQKFNRSCSRLFVSLQKLVKYEHNLSFGGEIRYGLNWVSITHSFVLFMLENEEWIRIFFKHTICCDEFYKQILAVNSKFRDALYDIGDDSKGSQRLVEWDGNNPRTYKKEDFEDLMSCPYLFARKFQDTVDKDIVDKIFNNIMSSKTE